MRDIFEGITHDDEGNQKKSGAWCSFICYLLMFLSFVLSICAAYKTTKGYLNKELFTYKFPMYKDKTAIPSGTPVSLDTDGFVQKGAGFGVYQNVSFSTEKEMKNLRSQVIWGTIACVAYNGNIHFYSTTDSELPIDNDDWVLPKTSYGTVREVEHLVKLDNGKLVIAGSNELLPLTVVIDKGKRLSIDVVFGKFTLLSKDNSNIFPHIDNLDDKTVAYVYEGKFQLTVGIATWTSEGSSFIMVPSMETFADDSYKYDFHGVAGMSKTKFIIAAAGRMHNGTSLDWQPSPIRVKVATIIENRKISVGNWKVRTFSESTSWFALDNFNEHEALITYYDGFLNNGVTALMLIMDDSPEGFHFGGNIDIETGGAMMAAQRLSMRILSPKRFGVFFPDASSNGNLIFMMGGVSPNLELHRVGPNFLLQRKGYRKDGIFWFDISSIDDRRFILIASLITESQSVANTNIGYHLAYPVGIVAKRSGHTSYVQFSGIHKYPHGTHLKVGYTYYTNSKGDLIAGKPYGFNNAEYANFNVDVGGQILALHNQIGIAVSETELLIRTY